MYTDHQGTDDQCALMISVAPEVPPVSAHQCHVPVPISATSMPHISAYLSCLSMSPISASQCHLSMPISATYQCYQSVPPISASQCRLSVRISASQCRLSVPVSAA
ncbi:unnamed protein product [Staurois parvus]|uniref:Uncharacterized protein n=2 Tax=Staurois parvus TaxID=386267 RepID=A0ABN9E8V2_9NEOB|nr:unnamed protein product [Staurois parvus]